MSRFKGYVSEIAVGKLGSTRQITNPTEGVPVLWSCSRSCLFNPMNNSLGPHTPVGYGVHAGHCFRQGIARNLSSPVFKGLAVQWWETRARLTTTPARVTKSREGKHRAPWRMEGDKVPFREKVKQAPLGICGGVCRKSRDRNGEDRLLPQMV